MPISIALDRLQKGSVSIVAATQPALKMIILSLMSKP